MRIQGLASVRMLDNDVFSVPSVPTSLLGDHYVPLGRGKYRSSDRSGKIDTVVSMDALGPNTARDRTQVVADLRECAGRRVGRCFAPWGNGSGWRFSIGNDYLGADREPSFFDTVKAPYLSCVSSVVFRER